MSKPLPVHQYLAEAQKRQHGEDGRGQREHQQVFADAVPLQAGVHQEGDQTEGGWSLQRSEVRTSSK